LDEVELILPLNPDALLRGCKKTSNPEDGEFGATSGPGVSVHNFNKKAIN
jgi:hypothetical protein